MEKLPEAGGTKGRGLYWSMERIRGGVIRESRRIVGEVMTRTGVGGGVWSTDR